jgi:hypothetical protein
MIISEWVVSCRVLEYKRLHRPAKVPTLEPKEVVVAKAFALGLIPENYDGDTELTTETDGKLHVTALGQVVRHYTAAKPVLSEMDGKV